jgi:pimeloyl-ACP methyl ester carboxylesterase
MITKATGSYLVNMTSEGSGPTLVLIHGVAGSLHIWDPIVERLSASFRVVRMDLLGYGHSPKPHLKYTPLTHVEAIRATLKENGIKPPYNLIGLSMGVNLALEYASRWPEEVDSFIGIGFPYYPTEQAALKGLHNNIWTRLSIEHPIIAQLFIPPIWWLGYHNIIPTGSFTKIYSPLMSHETLLNPYYVFKSSLLYCMVKNQQTGLLKSIGNKKRLFIHGSEDVWASPEEVAQAIEPYNNSRLKVIPNVGHNVVVLEPEVTAHYILDFLSHKDI